ncbi:MULTISPECIES: hypothetical protein [Mumia]|uniref:hypothetical protein n=1 Tax=Mumia TaxID=1546255 RepID=UPI001421AD28|nr:MULTISPECIES: hypothetical protein [unclassified Mumia]QMW67554.1 hypothetical protein H4N58_06580 [Mumia sp. ZJ1417]
MSRGVTLTERARGYGLWPGDLLASLPGATVEQMIARYEDRPRFVVVLSLDDDGSPLDGMPVRVVLTFDGARLRTLRTRLRARLPRATSRRPEVVELVRGRFGYRLLHTAGRVSVRSGELVIDVSPIHTLEAAASHALAS